MGKIKNVSFIENYILLERAADKLMNRTGGGIGAYITALERQKLNTDTVQTVKFLKKCRFVRNKLAHDPGALKNNSEITKKDIKRIIKLTALMNRAEDPLLRMLKGTGGIYAKLKYAAVVVSAVALAVTAIVLYAKQG